MKIPWSGRSHNFDKKDIGFLVNIIKEADPLTQGKFLEKFESTFSFKLKEVHYDTGKIVSYK